MSHHLAILAYGSLIDDPGAELQPLVIERHSVKTPFRVEFARSSRSRAGAPTLVPVFCEGVGEHVQAQLLVLKPEISAEKATHMLYRREIHQVGSGKCYDEVKARQSTNLVRIERLKNFANFEIVLYAGLPANLACVLDSGMDDGTKAERLANLAIKSVTKETYEKNKDGIHYLEQALAWGIVTPLTELYRAAILRKTGATNLTEAREVALELYLEDKL